MAEQLTEEQVGGVVWIAPETLAAQRRSEIVLNHTGTPEELLAKLDEAERNLTGEYRLISTHEVVEGIQGSGVANGTVQPPAEGQLVVWIDDAPDDPQDGAGHFEVYDAAAHGDPYAPIPSRVGAEPAIVNPPAEEA